MTLPNQLSILRIILTPIFIFFLLFDRYYFEQVATFVFIIASLTDWYDGYIARRYGYVSKWGKFLDPLADKVLISSALISFWILNYIKLWVVLVIVLRDFLVTGLRFYAIETRKPVVTGNLAKWKTFSQMLLIYLILIYINIISISGLDSQRFQNLIDKAALLVTFFTALTGVVYLFENRRHIRAIALRFYRVFIPSDL